MKLAANLSAGRCQESINPCRMGMEHPVVYVARVIKFLDRIIQELGEYLFVGFVLLCLLLIAWMIARCRKHPVHEVAVVILPLGNAPRREPDPEPPLYEEHPDQ
jgi:cobalamin biosynthesis protein CobD/CbiB